ncbi:MAG TPA: lysylphosphatidylglycerol synthase transmembrane domain-containing protein [bacterium]|nr:lysylphosphatidylglycerol synthase transmembrane domain-containing protein [bacterium]
MRRLGSFTFILGLVLFAVLLGRVDLPTSWRILTSARPLWTLLAFLFLLPEVFFKAWRIKVLSHFFHSRLTFAQGNWIYLSGQPLSAVTPAKLGDIVRVLGIRHWGGLKLTGAFAVHVADKVYDLLALGLFAASGLMVALAQHENQTPALMALVGLALGLLAMALFLNPQWMRSFIRPALLALAPQKLAKQLRTHGSEFYADLLSIFRSFNRVLLPFTLSLGAWFTVWVRAYFCALALGIPLSFGRILLLMPVVVVIEFIPVTLMGFGTREAALFLFFASAAVSKSALLSFSLLNVLAGPLFTSLVGIPCAWRLGAHLERKS